MQSSQAMSLKCGMSDDGRSKDAPLYLALRGGYPVGGRRCLNALKASLSPSRAPAMYCTYRGSGKFNFDVCLLCQIYHTHKNSGSRLLPLPSIRIHPCVFFIPVHFHEAQSDPFLFESLLQIIVQTALFRSLLFHGCFFRTRWRMSKLCMTKRLPRTQNKQCFHDPTSQQVDREMPGGLLLPLTPTIFGTTDPSQRFTLHNKYATSHKPHDQKSCQRTLLLYDQSSRKIICE